MKKQSLFWMFCGLVALLGAAGCGQKRLESTEVPKEPTAGGEVPEARTPLGRYLVERHDCLWTIAAKPRVYGDSFQWPILFKANRDQIQDPDLIYPRQVLKVEKGFSPGEANQARKTASLTPKYVPHSKPRLALPLDYF